MVKLFYIFIYHSTVVSKKNPKMKKHVLSLLLKNPFVCAIEPFDYKEPFYEPEEPFDVKEPFHGSEEPPTV